jgi:hypothetical protein
MYIYYSYIAHFKIVTEGCGESHNNKNIKVLVLVVHKDPDSLLSGEVCDSSEQRYSKIIKSDFFDFSCIP